MTVGGGRGQISTDPGPTNRWGSHAEIFFFAANFQSLPFRRQQPIRSSSQAVSVRSHAASAIYFLDTPGAIKSLRGRDQ